MGWREHHERRPRITLEASQVPIDLEERGEKWKELANKFAWCIGTTFGAQYAGARTWPKTVGVQLAGIVMRCGRQHDLADLYQASVQARKGGRCPRCSR